MLDGAGIQRDPGDENDYRAAAEARRDELDRAHEARWSVHPMQQQSREDHLEYYARRAREAQAQSDARKGEVYDDDLDAWRQGDPGDENDHRLGCEGLCGKFSAETGCTCKARTVVTKSEPDDRDTWVPQPTVPNRLRECIEQACAICGREALSCPSCSALCGPMGRVL